ncbi:MAG: NAD(P)/FAD-dependent oxidoreductase [Elusimicrobiota bacterium]|jgi:hypothetical protein
MGVNELNNIVVLGGGAAGFFAAIACAEANPGLHVNLLERTPHVLEKVRISGGGRCNVTHACFDPAVLVTYYPRGGKVLRGPFSRFQPRDTVAWFEAHGVPLKTEDDGRMFPETNQSQTIVDCLQSAARAAGVDVQTAVEVKTLSREGESYTLSLANGESRAARRVILTTGSSPLGWEWAKALGHTLLPPVPSLFTFLIADPRLEGLAGVSVPKAKLGLKGTRLSQTGALLITHQGLSGPAVLGLSAWGARELQTRDYRAQIIINWLPNLTAEDVLLSLQKYRSIQLRRATPGHGPFRLPRRLWERLASTAGIVAGAHWSEVSKERLHVLAGELTAGLYPVSGKNPNKEEYVTCGGVRLDEVDFRTMESKKSPGLYFAGEILDIDALTGGFNFQNAWTTGWIAGRSAAR